MTLLKTQSTKRNFIPRGGRQKRSIYLWVKVPRTFFAPALSLSVRSIDRFGVKEGGLPTARQKEARGVTELPDMMFAKFSDSPLPVLTLSAFGSDLFNRIHAASLTTSASPCGHHIWRMPNSHCVVLWCATNCRNIARDPEWSECHLFIYGARRRSGQLALRGFKGSSAWLQIYNSPLLVHRGERQTSGETNQTLAIRDRHLRLFHAFFCLQS